MPLDGTVVKNIVYELNNYASGGRIEKIYQPSRDEVIITVRAASGGVRLLLSCNPDFPRIHLTGAKRENPQAPPMFCMTLRKHFGGGKITGFFQPSLERIVEVRVESFNELGDLTEKKIIVEIMGRHSNIIIVNESGIIIDAAKRIGVAQSSVREALPGRKYVYPPDQGKQNPLEAEADGFFSALVANLNVKAADALIKSYCGISALTAGEACVSAGIFPSDYVETLDNAARERLFAAFRDMMDTCAAGAFSPQIIYDNGKPLDFASVEITQFGALEKRRYDQISILLEDFYGNRTDCYRLKQKTADLRKLLQNNIERCVKKRYILEKTLKDTEGMDEWRICGELLTAYMSDVPSGASYYDAQNYYDNEIKRIKLDKDLTPSQNASRYFDKYNRAKRQKAAATEQLELNETELVYLESVYSAVFSDMSEADIQEIREELFAEGYIKKNPAKKGLKKKSAPLHFVSSDGFDIYVGKNNSQNDELTLKLAAPGDIWLHTKEIPGSHVILKTDGREASEAALYEASLLAAYYSKARESSTVPVDYTQKRHVKKPAGAKPGMVIYVRNKTAYVTPEPDIINTMNRIE